MTLLDRVPPSAQPPVAPPPDTPRRIDISEVADGRPQPTSLVDDIFVGGALALDGDERDWVARSDDVSFKPLVLSISQGCDVDILRVRASGVLLRHRHSGPVHAPTLRGSWHDLEHDQVVQADDDAFEPPGETQTPMVPEGVAGMAALFHVTGGYTDVDPDGAAPGDEDAFTKLGDVRRHDERIGRSAGHADRLVR